MTILKIDNNILLSYKKILQDQIIKDIKIETQKEIRNINIIENITQKDLESKINHHDNKKKSYNAIILTSDNKIIFCTRKKSFYYDEFLQICKKNITLNDRSKILELFSNLSLFEKKNILHYIYNKYNVKKKYIKNFILKNFGHKFVHEIINYNKQYITTSEYSLYFKYIHNYRNYKINDKPINADIVINDNCKFNFNFNKNFNLLILPGGKNNNSENIITVLNREIYEEIGLYNILNNSYIYTTYYIQNTIYDKIINKYFTDITFLIITKINSNQFTESFKNNEDKSEIQNLIFINIPSDISYDKLLLWVQIYLIM
jgi:hypothetical protein